MSKSTQQEAPKGLVAVFNRNGSAKQTGDARYTLDRKASDVEDVEINGRSMTVMPIPVGDGHTLHRTINRNVYVPKADIDETVEGFTLRVSLEGVNRVTTPKASAGAASEASGAGDLAVLELLIAKGDADAVATQLAVMRGSSRVSKADRQRAEVLMS